MQQQLEAYQQFVQHFVDLEQQLMRAFESQVELVPPPPDFMDLYKPKLAYLDLDWENSTISQIVRLLPFHRRVLFPFPFIMKQRQGVIVLNEQHWLFTGHGSDEVRFTHLSPTVDVHLLEHLKQGKTNVLSGPCYGGGGCAEAKYLHEGRFDGVSAWSASVFAISIDCSFSHLSESEHQALLEALVDKGVLVDWSPIHVFFHRLFIFATAKGEAGSAGEIA